MSDLNNNLYETDNPVDPGEAPPSRPTRRLPPSSYSAHDVRANAARLLQTAEERRTASMRNLYVDIPIDQRNSSSDEEALMPSVQEARLYADRVLTSTKSFRDLSPESSERVLLPATGGSSNRNMRGSGGGSMDQHPPTHSKHCFGRCAPIVTPSGMKFVKNRRSMRLCLYATMGIAVLASLVAVSVHVSRARSTVQSTAETPTPVADGSPSKATNLIPEEPLRNDVSVQVSQRLSDTRGFLRSNSISSKDHLETSGSAQDLAAIWIADRDGIQYEIPNKSSDDGYTAFVQRYVLAVLYFSTHGTGWENQNSFLDKDHECAWFTRHPLADGVVVSLGVSCGLSCDDQSEVSKLIMPHNNMKGSLPTELSHLTKLHFVDFNHNALTGIAIPDTLSRLVDMKFYDVRYNTMTGTIPLWIGAEWPQLTELALADNGMGGALPGSMSLLHSLKSLALANNDFDGNLAPIMSLNSLEFLYLEKNEFEGTVDDAFMVHLQDLIQVDLSSNRLTGTDLPAHLFQYPKLRVLDLSDNSLMGQMPTNMVSNDALHYLALSDNILTGTLPPAIGRLSELQHLDVTGNDLFGPIPEGLASMSKLTYLFLSENGFEAGPIPDFLSTMHQLRELSLSSTQRTGVLPSHWLGRLSDLVLFDVSFNMLTGQVPPVMWDLPRLSFLLLNRNQLTGELPAGIADAAQLKMMLLDKNDITGDLSDVCLLKEQNEVLKTLIADCDEITGCTCCKCCSDSNLRCNDDILYTNQDFSWEHNYARTSYAFSPDILFESV